MKQLKSALTAGIAALAGTSAHAWELSLGNQTVNFHGFASQGFLYSSDYNYLGSTANGSMSFNEFGLNASISPFNRTRISAQAFAFDLGDVGNYKPFLDYAQVEYSFHDTFGIRGGRVRRPGGIYNHIQDVDLARTSVLLPQGIYDARWRDFSTSVDGGVLFGNLPAGKAGSVSYEAFGGVVSLPEDGGLGRLIQDSLPPAPIASFDGFDTFAVLGLQLWWATPVPGLRVGGMVGYVPKLTFHTSVNPPFGPGSITQELKVPFTQLSLEYLWKSWTFQAEYHFRPADSQTFVAGTQIASDRFHSDAWYVSAAYRFNPWLEVGSYYSEYYADTSDRSGRTLAFRSDAYQRDTALSVRFDIRDWWLIKLEGHYLRGTGLVQDNARNPVRDDNGWWMFAAKTTLSF